VEVTRIEDLRLRRNSTIRFALGAVLNWVLAVYIVVSTWIWVDAAIALHLCAFFVPIAIVSSVGLALTRKRPYQTKSLGILSRACVFAPLFWVLLIVGVGP
jgi:hypothetical protein